MGPYTIMAKLRSVAGLRAGEITVKTADKGSVGPTAVKLVREALPFDMADFTRQGLDTVLAARTLLWSGPNIGVVVRDKDKLFHGIETDFPRQHLGDEISFVQKIKKKSAGFDFVELVAIPIVVLKGSSQPVNSSKPCFVNSNLSAREPSTKAGQVLQEKIKKAAEAWDKWWIANVENRSSPPPPPDKISQPFVDIVAEMFGIEASEIAVLKTPDDLITDKISIDSFDASVRGKGGSTTDDLARRLDAAKKGDLKIVLQLQAAAFQGFVPMLGVLSTGIHEGAHYRHYVLTRQLIKRWHTSSSGRSQKSKPVTETVLRTTFGKFIDTQVRKKRLSKTERTIVHSTFGATQATHPFAQLQGFMGVHSLYPRELDSARSSSGRTLVDQPRFIQLRNAAPAWKAVRNPDVGRLSVEVIAKYAKQRKEKCIMTDLQELCQEALALKALDQGTAKFFAELHTELTK